MQANKHKIKKILQNQKVKKKKKKNKKAKKKAKPPLKSKDKMEIKGEGWREIPHLSNSAV